MIAGYKAAGHAAAFQSRENTMRRLTRTFALMLCTIAGLIVPANAKIGIVVNKDIYPQIRSEVRTYINDVVSIDHKSVWVDTTTFDTGFARSKLQHLRDSLIAHYRNDSLEGAVFIGNLPYATYEYWTDYGNSCEGEGPYPVDYYFMDLENIDDTTANRFNDSVWLDNLTKSTASGACTLQALAGVFDGYIGDRYAEIWVSRIISHNLFFDSLHIDYPDTTEYHVRIDSILGSESDIIKRYLGRVHARMTDTSQTPQRAFMSGDFKNWFIDTFPGIKYLQMPYNIIKFPHNKPSTWLAELKRGYEWATTLCSVQRTAF